MCRLAQCAASCIPLRGAARRDWRSVTLAGASAPPCTHIRFAPTHCVPPLSLICAADTCAPPPSVLMLLLMLRLSRVSGRLPLCDAGRRAIRAPVSSRRAEAERSLLLHTPLSGPYRTRARLQGLQACFCLLAPALKRLPVGSGSSHAAWQCFPAQQPVSRRVLAGPHATPPHSMPLVPTAPDPAAPTALAPIPLPQRALPVLSRGDAL